MKGFSTCFIHIALFLVGGGVGGLIPSDVLRKGNAVWTMQCAHDI